MRLLLSHLNPLLESRLAITRRLSRCLFSHCCPKQDSTPKGIGQPSAYAYVAIPLRDRKGYEIGHYYICKSLLHWQPPWIVPMSARPVANRCPRATVSHPPAAVAWVHDETGPDSCAPRNRSGDVRVGDRGRLPAGGAGGPGGGLAVRGRRARIERG